MWILDRLAGLATRARALVRVDRAERELDDELRFHVEMETEAGIERGLAPEAARRQALVKFGGVDRFKEEARDVRRVVWWDSLRRDLAYAFRLIGRSPAFSAAAILTLALGIGANTAIFSVVDAVLLRDSPFPDPERLVMVWETDRKAGTMHEPASWPDIADFRERSRTLESIGAVGAQTFTLAGGGEPERVAGLLVTPNLVTILGARPIVGRLFAAEEGAIGGGRVVLLGEEFWRERYGSDPAVVGTTLTLDEIPATIIGVLPEEADLGIRQVHDRADYAGSFEGDDVQVWVALRPTAEAFPRETHPFLTLARLAPGVSLPSAREELSGIAAELEAAYPENVARGVHIERYSDVVFGPVRPALLVLLGAVILVLLVTCANVINLLLARTTTRAREVAVRQALGADGSQIRRQFLVESAMLTGLGTVAGIAVAYGGLELLVALAPPGIPRLDAAAVDGRVLTFTAAVAAVVAVAFGMLPALQARGIDIQETLKTQPGQRVSEGRAGRRFRSMLVVAEMALAVTLVIGAGLLLRSLWELQRVDPGFGTEGVVKAQYQLPDARYPLDFSRWPDIREINDFHARLLAEVRTIPGVESAAISGGHPLDPGFTNSFAIVGREAESADYPEIRVRFLTAGYLEAVDVELLEGRGIREGDDISAPPVVLINRAAAERYFPDGTALGQQIGFWGVNRTIVGVIGDEKFRGVDAPTDPAAYAPLLQNPQQSGTVLVRAAGDGDPMALVPEIRRRLHALDPQIPLYDAEPLAATVSESLAGPRFLASLLGLFAVLALVLALVGVHGVLSYMVAQRATEVGIRMALGASRAVVLKSVMGEGLALAGAGIGLGLLAAYAGSRVLASLVFGVTTTDPTTFIAVPIMVILVASLASLVPGLRASRADPMRALRAE